MFSCSPASGTLSISKAELRILSLACRPQGYVASPHLPPPFHPRSGSIVLGVDMLAPGSALLVFSIMVQMQNTSVALHVLLRLSEPKLLHVKQEHRRDE